MKFGVELVIRALDLVDTDNDVVALIEAKKHQVVLLADKKYTVVHTRTVALSDIEVDEWESSVAIYRGETTVMQDEGEK